MKSSMEKKKYRPDEYIFACAAIACREKFLLTQDRIERMLDCKTVVDAARVLKELDYDEKFATTGTEYDGALSRELEKIYELVVSMAPDETYFDVLLYQNDYHNVKALLKAEFLGVDADEYLLDAGSYHADELKAMVFGRRYSDMRDEMARGIREVLESFGTTQDPQVVDLIIDKACFRDMNSMVAELEMDFLKEYLALKIDTINLTTFARAREMKGSRSFFSTIFIENGNIDENVFLKGYDEPLEHFADRLEVYGLHHVAHEGFRMLKKTGRFTALEKLSEDLLLASVESAKYVAYGIEPLFAYLVAKESEIKTVRIILSGLHARLSTDEIRQRVRATYA